VTARGSRFRRFSVVLTLLALAVATIGVASSGGAARQVTPATATLTATGSASSTFVPDVATLSFGSSLDRQKADAAISANAAVMQKIVDALKDAGGRDLGTDAVSLAILHPTSQPTVISGYEASNSVRASSSVDRMGALIDAAVAAGATSIGSPSFSSTGDLENRYRAALRDAVAQARQRAQVLADAAGVTLTRLVSLEPNTAVPVTAVPTAASAPATPIISPTQSVSATVTLVFAIQPR
jgi:uncharacterized protein YggE